MGSSRNPLTDDEIAKALGDRDGWVGNSGGISRTVEMPSFPDAIAAVDRIAEVAEEMDHHPDVDIRWRTLTFRCFTYSAGAVTANDMVLASRIDQIVAAAGGVTGGTGHDAV